MLLRLYRAVWEQYQTADMLKWTWRKKFIYMLILLHKDVPKNNQNFSGGRFFHLPLASTTPVVHLELRISPRIFKKKLRRPQWYTQELWGKWFIKNLKSKISWHCPFKSSSKTEAWPAVVRNLLQRQWSLVFFLPFSSSRDKNWDFPPNMLYKNKHIRSALREDAEWK